MKTLKKRENKDAKYTQGHRVENYQAALGCLTAPEHTDEFENLKVEVTKIIFRHSVIIWAKTYWQWILLQQDWEQYFEKKSRMGWNKVERIRKPIFIVGCGKEVSKKYFRFICSGLDFELF